MIAAALIRPIIGVDLIYSHLRILGRRAYWMIDQAEIANRGAGICRARLQPTGQQDRQQ